MIEDKLDILKILEVTIETTMRSLEVDMQSIWNPSRFYEYW